jgi:hypothetical protein
MAALNDVAADARWFRWLDGIDPQTGQVRRQLLDEARKRGDHARARSFIQQFEHARATGTLVLHSYRRSGMPPQDKPVYTRPQIAQLYSLHRRGAYAGREAEWSRIEHDIVRASAEGRIANAVPLAKNFGDGR